MPDTTTAKSHNAQAPAPDPQPSNKSDAKAFSSQGPSVAKPPKKAGNPARKERRQTKASKVEALLSRKAGTSIDQMCEATGWQAHTCRAFMSGLRKKGREIVREIGKAGKSIYRFGSTNSAAKAR